MTISIELIRKPNKEIDRGDKVNWELRRFGIARKLMVPGHNVLKWKNVISVKNGQDLIDVNENLFKEAQEVNREKTQSKKAKANL